MSEPKFRVIRKYVPPAGSIAAPGEHYTVACTEPERRVSPTAYRWYAFYRTAKGSEVAMDIGYQGMGPRHTLAGDGDLFREIKAVVEQYDREVSGS